MEHRDQRRGGSRAPDGVSRDGDARWPAGVGAAAEGVSVDPNAEERAVLHLIAGDEHLGRGRVDRDCVSGPNELVVRDRDPLDVGDDDAADPVVDLVKRAFGPGTIELDRVYVGDITYVRTWEGSKAGGWRRCWP